MRNIRKYYTRNNRRKQNRFFDISKETISTSYIEEQTTGVSIRYTYDLL